VLSPSFPPDICTTTRSCRPSARLLVSRHIVRVRTATPSGPGNVGTVAVARLKSALFEGIPDGFSNSISCHLSFPRLLLSRAERVW
jgi:hypothetical protein